MCQAAPGRGVSSPITCRALHALQAALRVNESFRECCMQEDLCPVNAMHISASALINDDERGLHQDYDDWLAELAPHEPIS
jgi:thiamine phosphate synthase YjbQ (UPF0047 family)